MLTALWRCTSTAVVWANIFKFVRYHVYHINHLSSACLNPNICYWAQTQSTVQLQMQSVQLNEHDQLICAGTLVVNQIKWKVITKVILIHPLGDTDVCSTFCASPSGSCLRNFTPSMCSRKNFRTTKVSWTHPLGTSDKCAKLHNNPSEAVGILYWGYFRSVAKAVKQITWKMSPSSQHFMQHTRHNGGSVEF